VVRSARQRHQGHHPRLGPVTFRLTIHNQQWPESRRFRMLPHASNRSATVRSRRSAPHSSACRLATRSRRFAAQSLSTGTRRSRRRSLDDGAAHKGSKTRLTLSSRRAPTTRRSDRDGHAELWLLRRRRPRGGSRSTATHPRLFGQQLESVDDGVNESVCGRWAGVLGDVGPDSSRSRSASADNRYGIYDFLARAARPRDLIRSASCRPEALS
jgi:hypothetical protein